MLSEDTALLDMKKQLEDNKKYIEGEVRSHQKGFGFLEVEGEDSVFINTDNMKRLRHGDIAYGTMEKNGDRTHFVPTKIVEEADPVFIARVRRITDKVCFVEPESRNDNSWYFLSPKFAKHLDVNDWVKVKLVSHPFSGKTRVNLVEQIAKNDDPKLPWKYAMSLNNIDSSYFNHVDIDRIINSPLSGSEKRVDLTELAFTTIDSESTRDMDDALHIEKQGDNFVLTIAIADPSELIKPETELDAIAKSRGYTVYLPSMTIPMIPHELSENLFSLREEEIRPVICCKTTVDSNGEVLDLTFFEATIKSKGKLAYNKVAEWLDNPQSSDWAPTTKEIESQLLALKEFSLVRCEYRSMRELVFKGDGDVYFQISNWEPVALIKEERNTAHKIVEECMILGNTLLARFCEENNIPCIYSVNKGIKSTITEDDLSKITNSSLNIKMKTFKDIECFKDMRREIDFNGLTYENLLLRKLYARTELSPVPNAHYGLGVSRYATWTSPIRKYSDLVNHRSIKAFLRNQKQETVTESLCNHLSEKLGNQRKAENTVFDWLHKIYLNNKSEKTLSGSVVGVFKSGITIALDETSKIVYVPKMKINKEGSEEVSLDENNGLILLGKKEKLRLGDSINVKIKSIDLENRSIMAEINI